MPFPLSLFVVTSLIEIDGASSLSFIVKTPVWSSNLPFFALDKFKFNVSLFSSNESSNIATLISPVVSPAAMVKVPDVEV